jgi:glutamate synthase domain-containing protein 2
VGQPSISPNRHPDVASATDLLDMINRVREVTGKPMGIMFVFGSWQWLEDLFIETHRRGIESAPDYISIDSGDGGVIPPPEN